MAMRGEESPYSREETKDMCLNFPPLRNPAGAEGVCVRGGEGPFSRNLFDGIQFLLLLDELRLVSKELVYRKINLLFFAIK